MRVMIPGSTMRRVQCKTVLRHARFMLQNAGALALWPLAFVVLTAILWAWVA